MSNVRLELTSASGVLHVNLAILGWLACLFSCSCMKGLSKYMLPCVPSHLMDLLGGRVLMLHLRVLPLERSVKGFERAQVVRHRCVTVSLVLCIQKESTCFGQMAVKHHLATTAIVHSSAASKSLGYQSAIIQSPLGCREFSHVF